MERGVPARHDKRVPDLPAATRTGQNSVRVEKRGIRPCIRQRWNGLQRLARLRPSGVCSAPGSAGAEDQQPIGGGTRNNRLIQVAFRGGAWWGTTMVSPAARSSLGMTLLHGFSGQLGGELTITSPPGLTITWSSKKSNSPPATPRPTTPGSRLPVAYCAILSRASCRYFRMVPSLSAANSPSSAVWQLAGLYRAPQRVNSTITGSRSIPFSVNR